jgi:hypothetical protein
MNKKNIFNLYFILLKHVLLSRENTNIDEQSHDQVSWQLILIVLIVNFCKDLPKDSDFDKIPIFS